MPCPMQTVPLDPPPRICSLLFLSAVPKGSILCLNLLCWPSPPQPGVPTASQTQTFPTCPISGCSFWGAMLKLWPRPPHHISPAPSGDGAVRGGKLRGCSSPLGRGWVLSRGQSGRGAVGGRRGKEPSRRCVEHDIGALKGVSSPAGGGSLGNFSRLWRGREGCPAP